MKNASSGEGWCYNSSSEPMPTPWNVPEEGKEDDIQALVSAHIVLEEDV